jgi:hypothetical protein
MAKTMFVALSALGMALGMELPAPRIVQEGDQLVAYLFDRPDSVAEQEKIDAAFVEVFADMETRFNSQQHASFLESLDKSLVAYSGHAYVPSSPVCDVDAPNAVALKSKSAVIKSQFPGGIVGRLQNFDMSQLLNSLAMKASSGAAASGGLGGILGMQAIMMTSMLIQSVVSQAIHIIPPLIPPPVWNNQPLTCVPMLTGHNCFGAIMHPITVTDFVMASSTDQMVSGYIASFPQTFADKVGTSPDLVYKGCFTAYMSMHCASIFPMCSSPQTGNDPTTKSPQRAPMCFVYCISTLVACPGFWIDDIIGQCEDVAAPPVCSTAFFWNLSLLPPQYKGFEGSTATADECPSSDVDIASGLVAGTSGAESAVSGEVASAAAASAGMESGATDTIKVPSPAAW